MTYLGRCKKGQVIILVAGSMVTMLTLTGLALDVGIAYGVKAKLRTALDGSSLAAGRFLSQGEGAARKQAKQFFDANFPSGTLGATVSGPDINSRQNADNSWTVTATASATVPTYFAKVVGWNSFSVSAISSATIRTLDLVLVLDTSGSLNNPPGTPALLLNAAQNFINDFIPSSTRVGVIHFANGAVQDVRLSTNMGFSPGNIKQAIRNITTFAGATTSEEALQLALAQLDSIPQAMQSSVRAIVFLSDGAPNGLVGRFADMPDPMSLYSETDSSLVWAQNTNPNNTPFRLYVRDLQSFPADPTGVGPYTPTPSNWNYNITTLPENDYTGTVSLRSYNNIRFLPAGAIPNSWCNANMAARNMAENVANLARSETPKPIYVFTIGLGNGVTTAGQEMTTCYGFNNDAESGQNILRRLANVSGVDTYNKNQPSGLYVYAQTGFQLQAAFDQIATAILRISK